MKKSFSLLWVILFCSSALYCQKLDKTYRLRNNHLKCVASYSSGNAVLFVETTPFILHLEELIKNPYDSVFKIKIKNAIDTMKLMLSDKDTMVTSSLFTDKGIINLTESYFSNCAIHKKANILDKRSNLIVRKFNTKKRWEIPPEGCTWTYQDFYLPNDTERFFSILKSIARNVQFL